MFFGEIMGPDLLIVVILIAVVLFGAKAIPKFARNLGSAKSEFEKGLKSPTTSEGVKGGTSVMKDTDAES
jgi:TatA/E family protein of Tat protein translocase